MCLHCYISNFESVKLAHLVELHTFARASALDIKRTKEWSGAQDLNRRGSIMKCICLIYRRPGACDPAEGLRRQRHSHHLPKDNHSAGLHHNDR